MATSQEVAEALGASLVRDRVVVENARTGIRLSILYRESDGSLKVLVDTLAAKSGFVASIAIDCVECVEILNNKVRFRSDRESALTITADAKVLVVQD